MTQSNMTGLSEKQSPIKRLGIMIVWIAFGANILSILLVGLIDSLIKIYNWLL